ncbi:MAG TPA: ester cyclase [Gemmatimonadaceae bacterium]
MSRESTLAVVKRYIDSNHSDLSMMADDVVFTDMNTGQEHRGVEGVRQMLNWVYHVAFDAHAETRNLVVADQQAVLEADFVGKHIGEFAGIPATNKTVRVPLCVTYDLENDRIKRGRIYMAAGAMMQQLTGS